MYFHNIIKQGNNVLNKLRQFEISTDYLLNYRIKRRKTGRITRKSSARIRYSRIVDFRLSSACISVKFY